MNLHRTDFTTSTIEDVIAALNPTVVSKPIELVIYIPDKDKVGEPINQAVWVNKFTQLLAHLFGGVTVSPKQMGVWENTQNGLTIKERTVTISSFVEPTDMLKHADLIKVYIHKFRSEEKQEYVMVRFNGVVCLF